MLRTAPLALLLAATALPRPAAACGGFFCSRSGPVVQQAEQIVFVDHGDGRQSTVVQVQYAGPSEQFSWIVPVPGVPEVGVSSNAVFGALDAQTRPQFRVSVEDGCRGRGQPGAMGAVDAGTGASDAGAAPPSGVEVLASGAVGPYDYEVIRPDPSLADPAAVAVGWLEDNGYDVGAIGPELLRPYLAMDQNLIAFRLQKTAAAGDIRPVVLSYRAERPLIPIQLTAVAARPDMGVLVWVLGPERAIPLNYLALEPNLALVDWFRGGANWPDVVTAAADAAGGQGFVTEMAAPLETSGVDVFPDWRRRRWDSLRAEDWRGRELSLLREINSTFRGWDGLMAAYEAFVPVPAETNLRDFLNCPRCFGVEGQALPGLDVSGFLARVAQDVVDPVANTVALMSEGRYLTRLFTTLSPEEMSKDPSFAFNPDLGDVDRTRRATARRGGCDEPFRVELEDGQVVVAEPGQPWPARPGDGDRPANRRVLRVGLEGPPIVLVDNSAQLGEALAPPEGSSSCRAAPHPSGLLALLLVLGFARFTRRFG